MEEGSNGTDKETGGFSYPEREPVEVRIGKRLSYLLRYGAEKEGLEVFEGGWVHLTELQDTQQLKFFNESQILEVLENSTSDRGTKRYETKTHEGATLVRATYGRRLRMEKSPYHEGTQVTRLLISCMDHICGNLDIYDLQDFPDEYLLNSMIHCLKVHSRLTTKALRGLLWGTIEHLNMEGAYLTEGSVKLIGQRCPHLKSLSFRDCGYVITDNLLQALLKRLPELQSLSLYNCRHLTDKTLKAICKNTPWLVHLNLCNIPGMSKSSIMSLVNICTKLKHLDLYDNPNLDAEAKRELILVGRERGMTVVMKGVTDELIAPDSPSNVDVDFKKMW